MGHQLRGVRGGGDEGGQAQRHAELVCGVHESAGGTGVLASHCGDAERRQRRERQTLSGADEHHGQRHGAQVGARGVDLGQPSHADQGEDDAGHQRHGVTEAAGDHGQLCRDGEVDSGHRQEPQPGLERGETEHVLHQLGGEEEEAHHRAQVQRSGCVGP